MASLREVRRRIGGIQKTQKITRAMKMVAAAKLRRRQSAVVAARPYAQAMKDLLLHLTTVAGDSANELMTSREMHSLAVVVVTSDRGFCGAFNSNLFKTALAHVGAQPGALGAVPALKVICVGKKGTEYFSKRGYHVTSRYAGVSTPLVFAQAQAIARDLVAGYRNGAYDRVDVVYNEFKSISQRQIAIEQFLPIPAVSPEKGRAAREYICEPGGKEILDALVPRYLSFALWRVLLESNAAEEGARMAAMESATDNAEEIISTLQLQYNKARQSAITTELLEIVSGAEALASSE